MSDMYLMSEMSEMSVAVWREKVLMSVSKNLPLYRSLGLQRVGFYLHTRV